MKTHKEKFKLLSKRFSAPSIIHISICNILFFPIFPGKKKKFSKFSEFFFSLLLKKFQEFFMQNIKKIIIIISKRTNIWNDDLRSFLWLFFLFGLIIALLLKKVFPFFIFFCFLYPSIMLFKNSNKKSKFVYVS